MADTTKGDSTVLYQGLLVPALMSFIAGLVIHSFIIGVNVNDWWKGRSVTPVDHVVTSLGITRMCSQCVFFLDSFLLNFFLASDSHLSSFIMGQIYGFLTYANTWLTSLLSIVLCLKISNLHTRLFLYLRRVILHRTLYLIVSSLLLSALNSLIHVFFTITEVPSGGIYNTTLGNIAKNCIHIDSVYYFTIGAFIPMLFYYISSVFLFTSLYHHTTRMKMSSNLSINLETYYSVMRFVSFTFMYITMYFIGHFAGTFYYYFYCSFLLWLFIIVDILPVLHSSCLIYRTAKLKDQMSKVLHNVIYFLLQRKDTQTRENTEMIAK